ncbi:MAG: tetratricopeptide repeat protein [Candidatus Kapabacteria bacterium]|nr:tetratricopeptide repeat protein [Candidatus Kapabacteria bacterium]
MAKALRHKAFRLIIIEYNNTAIYQEIAAFLRTTYPERPQREIRFIGNDYRSIMDSLNAAQEAFVLIPDFDRIFDANNAALCVSFNQRRDYFANRNMVLLCFMAPENVMHFPEKLPDLWSLRSLEFSFFQEPSQISDSTALDLESTIDSANIIVTSFNSDYQEEKERELASLLSQLEQSDEKNFTLHYYLTKQISNIYLKLNRSEKALENAERSLVLARQLQDSQHIIDSLFLEGIIYAEQNDFVHGIARYNEALSIARELAQSNQNAFLPQIAMTLNNLGMLYKDTHQFIKAEQAYTEALSIKQTLSQTNSETYLPFISNTLNNLGNLYIDIHQFDKAEKVLYEALSISRTLAETSFEAYINNVAAALTNLGILFITIYQLNKAEQVLTEALSIRRELAQTHPDRYLSNELAITLHNLGIVYSLTNQHSNAEQAFSEALAIRRELAKTNSDAYLPRIASTLNNLGNVLKDSSKLNDAEQAFSEALSIRRDLAKTYPNAYSLKVAQTAGNFSLFYLTSQPDSKRSLALARETLEASLPFEEKLSDARERVSFAKDIVRNWGLDAEAFVEEIRKNMTNPPTQIPISESE